MSLELKTTSLRWGLIGAQWLLSFLNQESSVEHWHEESWCREISGQSWVRSSQLGDDSQPWVEAVVLKRTPLLHVPLSFREISFISSCPTHSFKLIPLCHSHSTEANHCFSKGKSAWMQFSLVTRAARQWIAGCHCTNSCAPSWCILYLTPLMTDPFTAGKSLIWTPKKSRTDIWSVRFWTR